MAPCPPLETVDWQTYFQAGQGAAATPNSTFGGTSPSRGAGALQYISGDEPLRYAIFFENLETASAPAQEVIITDQLDTANVDLSTLSFGPIAIGEKRVVPPPGLSAFATDVDLRPSNDIIVRIEASLNQDTELLTWRFIALDPATGEIPEDPLAGFWCFRHQLLLRPPEARPRSGWSAAGSARRT